MGLLLLTLIISGLTLHALLFIEMQLNGVVLAKPDKNNDPILSTFLINTNIFIRRFATSFF